MSKLHINQIKSKITALFEEHLDLSDLKATDKEREHKIATRCLAAFAVYSNVECTAKEAAEAVTDGGDDNGIDAFYYSPIEKQVLIVQSKLSQEGTGEPNSTEIASFTKGIRDLFESSFDRFNNKIKKKQRLIESALNAYDVKCRIVFIDTFLAQSLGVHALRHIDDLLNEMNNIGDDNSEQIVTFVRMNQSKVYNTLGKSAADQRVDIEISLSNWGQVTEPYKAYYGMASGTEIGNWWATHNKLLFTSNLRQSLGVTDVNEEIQKTLKENQSLFWYYNNGITITCDRIDKTMAGGGSREFGSFKLINARIVNGAQTVSTIGRFFSSHSPSVTLDEVKISARVIQLSEAPLDFGKDVTRTNNRQNRIENRDFVSQDPEQTRIKMELAMDGIEYNVMRSESYASGKKSFDLSEATVSLACASGISTLAVQAKSGIGRFWENIDKGIYKQIFNPNISGYYVYNSVKLVRIIEEVINKEIQQLPKRSGRSYGLLVQGNRMIEMLTITKLGVRPSLEKIDFEPNLINVEIVTKEVIRVIRTYIDQEYPDSFLATLFKNSGKCAKIVTHVRATLI
ncbi:hypothetical protein A0256_14645 [Mucilaginibacter sp. PAMC 26640]|nr:hypothetical protein A0256_14645 [Mucilaginibacter sp. PAMC 26640]